MSVINTNITSMIGQSNLSKSQNALQTSMERLSSGLRINSAKDDAAGQAIANRMTSQINGLAQAQRNSNDGISIAQTAEGGLNQINDNLQRIRELTVQSANGTNSENDLQSIQDEVNQRLEEINRISRETDFNGTRVLSEDTEALTIQVGSQDGQTITVDLRTTNAESLGLANLDLTNQVRSADLSEIGGDGSELTAAQAAQTVELTYSGAEAGELDLLVGADGNLYAENGSEYYLATYDSTDGTVSYDTTADAAAGYGAGSGASTFVDGNGDLVQLSDANAAAQTDTSGASTFSVYQDQTDGSYVVSDGTNTWGIDGTNNTLDLDTGEVVLTTQDGTANTLANHDQVSSGNVLDVPGTAAVNVDMTDINADLEGTNTLMEGEDGTYFVRNENDGDTAYYSATVDAEGAVTLGDLAPVDPLASIDSALNQIDSFRSELGAVQNRFEDAITNLSTNETNLSAARSRIEDADYAVEVANMTRAQILQQAGTSVLAQANQIPQNVLSLLG
ncbi:flagellin [Vreelandella venusta]|uniref:Flagellin n=1 Tax=Halomonas hydrothermalis TaxID=115561 RepID=A0A6F8U8L6_9GAMM|nr:FliC/FljB family flagellin [Halomonas hydrothermalis]BCB09280.1 flagellin [Halomonas hydrothermalis]